MPNKHIQQDNTYCGYVALIGRPNVGKSTLLNHILSQKVSITSRKPQTTRHRITGIHTQGNYQTVYVDTPGIHSTLTKKVLNRYLNRAAKQAIHDVDIIVMVIEALQWQEQDDDVLAQVKQLNVPVILAVNKVDLVNNKQQLLPFLQDCAAKFTFADIFPISARKHIGLDTFSQKIQTYLPESPHLFAPNQLTDRNNAFRVAEIIREKLTRLLGNELPYAISVSVEKIEDSDELVRIHAIIWAERDSQKGIIIGKSGELLKNVGTQARIDLQKLYNKKVFLRLWVKTRSGWSDDIHVLRSLGYDDTDD